MKHDAMNCCPPSSASAGPESLDLSFDKSDIDEELAALTKAVGHTARVKILKLLLQRDSCVCGEIVVNVDLAQSTVSQHLKVLKNAGLIRGEVEGTTTCYCLNRNGLERLKELIKIL